MSVIPDDRPGGTDEEGRDDPGGNEIRPRPFGPRHEPRRSDDEEVSDGVVAAEEPDRPDVGIASSKKCCSLTPRSEPPDSFASPASSASMSAQTSAARPTRRDQFHERPGSRPALPAACS